MVTRAHLLALVRVALQGPSDPREVSPDNVWRGPRWSALDLDDLAGINWRQQLQVWRQVDHLNAEDVAGMLYDANAASVRYLYADADVAGMVPAVPAFTLAAVTSARRLTAVEALNALAGYEYQACEDPRWRGSEARRFCESLRRSLCDFLTRNAGCWSIPDTVPA